MMMFFFRKRILEVVCVLWTLSRMYFYQLIFQQKIWGLLFTLFLICNTTVSKTKSIFFCVCVCESEFDVVLKQGKMIRFGVSVFDESRDFLPCSEGF